MNLIQQNMIYQILMYRKIKNRTCGNWKCTTEFDKIDYLLMEYVLQILIRWINFFVYYALLIYKILSKWFQFSIFQISDSTNIQHTYKFDQHIISLIYVSKKLKTIWSEIIKIHVQGLQKYSFEDTHEFLRPW